MIQDIRLFESDEPNVEGSHLPGEVGEIHHFPSGVNDEAAKIAHLLNAKGFSLGDFDTLYLNFTTCERPGELGLSSRVAPNGAKYVDIGIGPEWLTEQPEPRRLEAARAWVFAALRLFTDDRSEAILTEVEKLQDF